MATDTEGAIHTIIITPTEKRDKLLPLQLQSTLKIIIISNLPLVIRPYLLHLKLRPCRVWQLQLEPACKSYPRQTISNKRRNAVALLLRIYH